MEIKDKHLEIHNILKTGLKDLNKLHTDNPKYWLYDKKELNDLLQANNDIIDHMNDFIAEVLDDES